MHWRHSHVIVLIILNARLGQIAEFAHQQFVILQVRVVSLVVPFWFKAVRELIFGQPFDLFKY